MIKQTNNYVGRVADSGSGGNSTDQLMPSGQIESAVDKGLKVKKRATIPAASVGLRKIEVQTLEAHVERRGKLTERIKAENPSRTEEEIEARLEQFGA